MAFFIHCALAALIFLVLDAGWLTVMRPHFMELIKPQNPSLIFNTSAAIGAYILLLLALCTLVLPVWFETHSYLQLLIRACIVGLVIYGEYELINKTLFPEWPTWIVFADTLWGMLVFSISAVTTAWALSFTRFSH